jgi:hypothetical protein
VGQDGEATGGQGGQRFVKLVVLVLAAVAFDRSAISVLTRYGYQKFQWQAAVVSAKLRPLTLAATSSAAASAARRSSSIAPRRLTRSSMAAFSLDW